MENLAYQIVRDGFALTYLVARKKIYLKVVVDAPAPKAFPATTNKYIGFPVTQKGLQELKEWYRDAKAAWEALVELAQEARGEQ